MRNRIQQLVLESLKKLKISTTDQQLTRLKIEYPDPAFADYSSNAALILSKENKMNPKELAEEIIEVIDKKEFESIAAAGPGFINFRLKTDALRRTLFAQGSKSVIPEPVEDLFKQKILVEYFQPNIAKPLHIGHMRTAVIGDAIKRMLKYLGVNVESDTHMGDWGTQFGFLILAYKQLGKKNPTEDEINKSYVELNDKAEHDPQVREAAKQEFVKLEKNDKENRKIWKNLVDTSVKKFLSFAKAFGLYEFEHHWPESFYEDKMTAVLEKLEAKGVLVESQGAKIVHLEDKNLGVAVILKSDGGTTYLLRDLATAIHRKSQEFTRQLYVVDSRQSLALEQTYAILLDLKELQEGEAYHVDYGLISFKGKALSTRKGNSVLANDLIKQAQEKVAKIIQEKNPDLKEKEKVINAVAIGALKYFDLKHNRHSDIEFSWDEALDFEGDSGPYLQYAYARLTSILKKSQITNNKSLASSELQIPNSISNTERQIMFQISIFNEVIGDSVKEYLPNILANYLYNLATLSNKFYHESQVLKEKDKALKSFRLQLVESAKNTLSQGLNLLGISIIEEM